MRSEELSILKRELKSGLKPFIFWTIGLFFLVFAGMIKSTGLSAGGASVGELIGSFPRIVQAVLGMVDLNIETLGGFYAVLFFYALILTVIYAIYLGSNAVNREAVDKTYEFIFTKPRNRNFILLMKLKSGFVYLLAFSLLNYLFSISAVATLNLTENINTEMLLFSISLFLVGFLFFCLSAFLSASIKRIEKSFLYGNLSFVIAFIFGIIFDMLENGGLLRVLSPLKYFLPKEILGKQLNICYLILTLVLCTAFLSGAFYKFDKKDLQSK